jgi:DnaJ-class molecular chaperone
MNKNTIILILLITVLISFTAQANPERPTFCASGCHEITPMDRSTDENECGTCHLYISTGKIDVLALEATHNPNICKVCHRVKTKEDYHKTHGNVTCDTCHGTGQQLPKDVVVTACASCHGVKVHDIHEDKDCKTCHGSAQLKTPQDSNKGSQGVASIYARVIDYQGYTLYELIKRLFNWS